MPDLITQFKQNGESVLPAEYNELIAAINSLNNQIGVLSNSLNQNQASANRFSATGVPTSLNVNVIGGVLRRVADGVLLNIPNTAVAVPPNVTNHWICVNRTGVFSVTAKRIRESYAVAQVTSNATGVTSLIDRRSQGFEIDTTPLRKVVQAVKSAVSQTIFSGGAYQTISGFRLESADGLNEGSILDLANGTILMPFTGEGVIFARVQITSPSVTNLSAKLALFVGATELRILEEKDLGGTTRITLSGTYEGNFNQGDLISLRVGVGSGSGLIIPSNNNTEIIFKVYG
jgi:hypothetical protein